MLVSTGTAYSAPRMYHSHTCMPRVRFFFSPSNGPKRNVTLRQQATGLRCKAENQFVMEAAVPSPRYLGPWRERSSSLEEPRALCEKQRTMLPHASPNSCGHRFLVLLPGDCGGAGSLADAEFQRQCEMNIFQALQPESPQLGRSHCSTAGPAHGLAWRAIKMQSNSPQKCPSRLHCFFFQGPGGLGSF